MKKRKVFLTGATGLVGSKLIDQLEEFNYNIIATSRNPQRVRDGVTWVTFDASNDKFEILDKWINECDFLIHNAAVINEHSESLWRVNVDFTKYLLEQTTQSSIKRFIFTSTLSFLKKPLPPSILETSEIEPILKYSKTKLAAENLILSYSRDYGVNYNIFRISSPINPNKVPETVIKIWYNKLKNGEPITVFGEGKRSQDFLHVSDYARVCLEALNREVDGIFNIASGNVLTMENLAKLMVDRFGGSINKTGKELIEEWNVSIEKSKNLLGYRPIYTSNTAIQELLNNLK